MIAPACLFAVSCKPRTLAVTLHGADGQSKGIGNGVIAEVLLSQSFDYGFLLFCHESLTSYLSNGRGRGVLTKLTEKYFLSD